MEKIVKNEARRDFLKVSGSAAGGLALAFYLPTARQAQAADGGSPNAWVNIAADNTVTIQVARSEMGQDVYTSMPMLVAEELEVDLNAVKVAFAPPAEVYINSLPVVKSLVAQHPFVMDGKSYVKLVLRLA